MKISRFIFKINQFFKHYELGSISKLDITGPIFVQNFVVTVSFQSETNQIRTTTSLL